MSLRLQSMAVKSYDVMNRMHGINKKNLTKRMKLIILNIIFIVTCFTSILSQAKYVGEKKDVTAYSVSTSTIDTRTLVGAQVAFTKNTRVGLGFQYLYGQDPSLQGLGISVENGIFRPISSRSVGMNVFLFGAKTWTKNKNVKSFSISYIYNNYNNRYDEVLIPNVTEETIGGEFGTVGLEFYLHATDGLILLEPTIKFARTFSKNPAKYGDEKSIFNSIVFECDFIFNRSANNYFLFSPGFTWYDKYKSSLSFKCTFIHSVK